MSQFSYTDAPFATIEEKVGQNFILLVTATNTETDHLHAHIKPLDANNTIYKIYKDSLCYYLGTLGYYNIIHVQCGMGATSRDAAIMTISSTINDVAPKIVIMIGIAFGINNAKQKIGDVLVSEIISPYELIRVGSKTIQRSMPAYASKVLVSRFKGLRGWEHKLPDGRKAKIIIANILSGEKLIDKISFRNKLLRAFPTADGGEMEGAGLFAACDSKADWILIKGICDFADGEKKINKDENQAVAVEAAIATSMVLFGSKYSFDGLSIKPISESEIAKPSPETKLDLLKIFETKPTIELPTSPEFVDNILQEFIDDSNSPKKMLKQVQELVKAFLSLTEVDKIEIARRLNLDAATMIELSGHVRDKLIFSEIKSKNLLAELWDEVFKLIIIENNHNPFKS
ncbi:hypothetical protein GCM10028805_45970 [Spirosoma harenae]